MRYAVGLLFVVLVSGVCLAYSCPSTPSAPKPPMLQAAYNMMGPAVQTCLHRTLDLKEKAHSLLDQAVEQDLDVSEIEDLLDRADALLEKTQAIATANPIPATNMCREAAGLYEDVISDLEALLG